MSRRMESERADKFVETKMDWCDSTMIAARRLISNWDRNAHDNLAKKSIWHGDAEVFLFFFLSMCDCVRVVEYSER